MISKEEQLLRADEIEKSLIEAIRSNILKGNDFIWIGLLDNPRGRKYKYELYFYVGSENLEDGVALKDQFDNTESLMCKSKKVAYSNAYYQIRTALLKDSETKVIIKDLIPQEYDED